MNILLEYWKQKSYDIIFKAEMDENPTFREVNLLPQVFVPMDKDVLYIGLLSEALGRDRNGATVLCIRDRMADDDETDENMAGIAVVCKNMPLAELFNETVRLFSFLHNWNFRLYEALSTGYGAEALFDIIEELGDIYPGQSFNFVHVTDSDFSLLGYTKNIEIDDPGMRSLISAGRYDAENVLAFEKFNCAREWECSYAYPIVSQIKLLKYPVVIKTARFSFGFIQIVMVCNNIAPMPGLIELFNVAADVLIRCIHTTISFESKVNYPFHKLLIMLLKNGKAVASGTGKMDTLGIPVEGLFNVFVISWLDTSDYKIDRTVHDISAALPEAYTAAFDGQIVLLNVYPKTDLDGCRRQTELRLNRIEAVWNHYNAVCGVSSPFTQLGQMLSAYKQANSAIECAHWLIMQGELGYVDNQETLVNTRTYYYDNLCMYDFFRCEEDKIGLFAFSDSAAALARLREDDQLHHRDNCKVLYTFLNCERSPSKTAAELNMHKNNVVYRMQKIQSIINCNLDDPNIRLKLLMAYRHLNWFAEN